MASLSRFIAELSLKQIKLRDDPEGVTRELGGRADNGFRLYISQIKAAFIGGFTG